MKSKPPRRSTRTQVCPHLLAPGHTPPSLHGVLIMALQNSSTSSSILTSHPPRTPSLPPSARNMYVQTRSHTHTSPPGIGPWACIAENGPLQIAIYRLPSSASPPSSPCELIQLFRDDDVSVTAYGIKQIELILLLRGKR